MSPFSDCSSRTSFSNSAVSGSLCMAACIGAFLIRDPSMTTMIIMMLTTLATISKKESGFTASVFSLTNLGMMV